MNRPRIEDGGLRIEHARRAIRYLRFSSSNIFRGAIMPTFIIALGACLAIVIGTYPLGAQTLEQLVAGAKKEGEVTLVASASTFGAKKGFAELESGFNKRFGLKHKVTSRPGRAFRRWLRGF